MKFEIKADFLLDGRPIKIISGAVHYFRITPDQWQDTLYNLKAMGCNTVETYVPWNLHEPQPGQFNFTGRADLPAFIALAQSMDLLIILRPAPFICAEWEFGGLPAWLLDQPRLRIRTDNPLFLERVAKFYDALFQRVVPYQVTHGGRLIMMQVENEYGSYGSNKKYLHELVKLMRSNGVDVPLFTSDGGSRPYLVAGSLIDEDILPTVNFGTKAAKNMTSLRSFMIDHQKKLPLMCMEFWDGWFNNWGQPIVRRDAKEMATEVGEILQRGSINFYMFRGGTNFGFYNGCSERDGQNYPQVTSYDYDAILTEWGAPTAKFYQLQKLIKKQVPTSEIKSPVKPILTKLATVSVTGAVSLFRTLKKLAQPVVANETRSFAQLNQSFGYVLYQAVVTDNQQVSELILQEAADRCQIFLDHQWVGTQTVDEIGDSLPLAVKSTGQQLQILVENTGRNNYGAVINLPIQDKGIRGGILQDARYLDHIQHYGLPLTNLAAVDYSLGTIAGTPTFYQATFMVTEPVNTFIDCREFGKGVIFINGENLGRYWNQGPIGYLYLPSYFLKKGKNEIVIFETEGVIINKIKFSSEPLYFPMEHANATK